VKNRSPARSTVEAAGLAATLADITAAIDKAYQLGRLEVIGQVNIQRVRTLRERYDSLLEQAHNTPTDALIRRVRRLRRQLIRACETGARHEDKLQELLERESP
jgi:hypothetical protein